MAATKKIPGAEDRKKIGPDEAREIIERRAIEHIDAGEEERAAKARKEEIKAEVMPLVRAHGETDDKGQSTIKFEDSHIEVTIQVRETPLFTENAEDILKKLGILRECQSLVLDGEKIQDLYQAGKITEKQLGTIVTAKKTEAFICKRA